MREDATMQRRLSLTGHMHRMIPEPSMKYTVMHHTDNLNIEETYLKSLHLYIYMIYTHRQWSSQD